jgi:hypothetical protein
MAVLTVYTVGFMGRGALDCKRCGAHIDFGDDQQLVLFDDGASFFVVSALDLLPRHRCGRELYFWCQECNREVEPVQEDRWVGRRRRRNMLICNYCLEPTVLQLERAIASVSG